MAATSGGPRGSPRVIRCLGGRWPERQGALGTQEEGLGAWEEGQVDTRLCDVPACLVSGRWGSVFQDLPAPHIGSFPLPWVSWAGVAEALAFSST